MSVPLSSIVEIIGLAELLLFVLVLFGLLFPLWRVPIKITVQSKCSQNIGALLFLVLIAAICVSTFGSHDLFFWTKFSPPVSVQIIGEVILLPSIVLMGWSQYCLGKQWTAAIQIVEDHELVVTGPYGYIRHPFLLSILLVNIGAFLFAGGWLNFVAYLLNFAFSCYLIPLEERALMAEFGMDYLEYRQNTGAFLPKTTTCLATIFPHHDKDSELSRHSEELFLVEPVSDTISKYGSIPV
jgi:protein-S-isoprenylcysteine O-methyltransferase Ste14